MSFNVKVLAAALGLAGLFGYLVFFYGGNNQLPSGIVSGNGRIEAVQVDISTKIPGRVDSIQAQEGDLVKPGEILAKIDDSQLQAQLARAEADIASAQSQVAQAEAQITQAKAQLQLAETELGRTSRLLEQGHVSQEAFDTRKNTRDVAQANLTAAQATLISKQRGVDAAVAVKKEVKTQIDDCVLVAPTLGRVLYRLAEPGEVMAAGGKVLTLVNLADVYMEIFIPAEDAYRLSIGSDARIVVDGTDFAVPGKVTFVSPEAQFTPKQVETSSEREKLMFRVKVRIPPELIEEHINVVKTGIRGVAYVRPGIDPPPWPAWLEKRYVPSEPKVSGS